MRKFHIILITAFAALVACSKAPKEYNKAGPPINNPNSQKLPSYTDVENASVNVAGSQKPTTDLINNPNIGEGEVGGKEYDAKVKFNSSQPIIYGSGAGGITFATSLTDSEAILSKPRVGPDINGDALYDEGLYIRWRKDEPRVPSFILLLQSYLGSVQMPAPMKAIPMNHDFSTTYPANTESGAEAIARDFYRIFEKLPDDYDCIAKLKCSIEWGTDEQKNFVVDFPGRMQWLISKDRFVVFRMIMFMPQPGLEALFDITSGTYNFMDGSAVKFGDTYESVETMLAQKDTLFSKVLTNVRIDSFARVYGGSALSYQRTNFDRLATTPQTTDKLKSAEAWESFTGIMTAGELPIMVHEYADKVEVVLGTADSQEKVEADHREIYLKINMGLNRKNVRSFVQKLRELMVAEFKKAYPGYQVASRFSGAFQKKTIKTYLAYVVAYNPATNDGIYIQFDAGEERGNVGSFFIMKLGGEYNPLDAAVVSQISTPVTKNGPTYTELSGFKIGDVIAMKDWDLGRNEATVMFEINGKQLIERATYADRAVQYVAFNGEKDVAQDQSQVDVSSMGASLGLKLMGEKDGVRMFKVATIRSNANVTEVQGICGSSTFKPTFGMSDLDFMTQLQQEKNCLYLPKYDTGGNGRLLHVYFPNDRVRLSFGDQELTSTTVYAPISEVK